ncbi:MAG: CAP domain-containing protein [bacterium]
MKKSVQKPKFLNNSIRKKAKDGLIPTAENDYCPKILHSKSLSAIVALLIMFKVFITLFLFIIYPNFVYLSTDIYHQIIELANKTRIEEGVPPLKVNPILEKAAKDKAQDMLLNQYFAHDTSDGKKPWQWIDKKEYDYTNAGENLAMNFTSAEVAHLALLASATHKKNIVNPKFNDIGVAVLIGEMNGKKTMVMVEMFGKERDVNQEIKKTSGGRFGGVAEPVPATGEVPPIRGVAGLDGLKENQENNLPIEVMGEEIDLGENYPIEPKVKEVEVKQSALNFKSSLINVVLKYFDYFMFFGLGFLALILILNILIKIQIQHPAVIFQSLAAVAIIIFLITAKFHFFQSLAQKVIIG